MWSCSISACQAPAAFEFAAAERHGDERACGNLIGGYPLCEYSDTKVDFGEFLDRGDASKLHDVTKGRACSFKVVHD